MRRSDAADSCCGPRATGSTYSTMLNEPRPLLSRMGAFGVPALFQGSLTPRCERHLRAGKSKPIALTRQLPIEAVVGRGFLQAGDDGRRQHCATLGGCGTGGAAGGGCSVVAGGAVV